MANTFKSKNLIYRALDFPTDDTFILSRIRDHQSQAQSYPGLPMPGSKADFEDVKKYYEGCLIIVVICLPSAKEGPGEDEGQGGKEESRGEDVPIGTISLSSLPPRFVHHRRAEIGVQMVEGYRGKGYGSEAIEWILQYGFQIVGLHRIGIGGFGYNQRALDLYERLGFVVESRTRDFYWYDGGWHDGVGLSMLEHEWRARSDRKLLEAERKSV
ncbi:acyl-CoA N-acyltransferase [Delphinella strobiligena]|nr:acyl-CoA N-acyltransferase [Delphinella strobiligena]